MIGVLTNKRWAELTERFGILGLSFIENDAGLWCAEHRKSGRRSDYGTKREALTWADGFTEGREQSRAETAYSAPAF